MSSLSASDTQTKPRFFYGWFIVMLAFLGSFINAGTNGYIFGQFIRPLAENFGWTISFISSIQLVRNITQIATVPFIGRIADRIGSRVVMLVGVVIAGGSFIVLSQLQEPAIFYFVYAIVLSSGYMMLGGVPSQAAVARWFRRRRGFAFAMQSVGISAGGIVMVPIAQWLLNTQGWRFTFGALGVGILALMLPLVWWFMRDSPEAMGLRPDGDEPALDDAQSRESSASTPQAASAAAQLADDRAWETREIIRHPNFWKQALGYSFGFAMLQTIQIFQYPHIVNEGYEGNLAAFMVSVYAFFAGSSKFVWGYWADRNDVRKLATIGISLAGLGTIILGYATTIPLLYLYAVVAGIGIGGLATMQSMVTATSFGRKSYGTVAGLLNPMNSIASGLAVPMVGYLFDLQKSYTLGFIIVGVLSIVASWSLLTLPQREK